MDNFSYIIITHIIVLISFIALIALITVILVKKECKRFYIPLFLIIFLGLYLAIPQHLTCVGFLTRNVETLLLAKKLSINPYERKICDLYIANNYAYSRYAKNGAKAIEHFEKAFNGEYEKYKPEIYTLAYLYSIKNDYDKTKKLCEIGGVQCSLPLRNFYIQNGEYEKALSTFNKKRGIESFLKADLYKQIGDLKNERNERKEAEKYVQDILKNMPEKDKTKYLENIEKYKSVENYKNWILEQKKEYNF